MADKAFDLLNEPQIRKLRPHEDEVLDAARSWRIDFEGREVQYYQWGEEDNDRRLLLVHGWEGQAGNFSDIIERLLSEGYTVRAFDAPSHGRSESGPTDFFAFGRMLSTVLDDWQVDRVISHSFGGVAMTLALSERPEYHLKRYALLTTPDTLQERIDSISEAVGISEQVKERLIAKVEERTGKSIEIYKVRDKLPEAKIDRGVIYHDVDDRVISIDQSRWVADNWPQASLVEIHGTGHFRILRTKEVIDTLMDFMS